MSCYCAVLKQANKVCVWPATKSELLTSAAQLIYTFRSVHFSINTSIIFLITCSPSSLIIRPSTHTEQMFSHLLLTISTLKRIRWLFINKNVFFFSLAQLMLRLFIQYYYCFVLDVYHWKRKKIVLVFALPFYWDQHFCLYHLNWTVWVFSKQPPLSTNVQQPIFSFNLCNCS